MWAPLRSDLSSGRRIDRGLEHELHTALHDIDAAACADSVERFVQVTLGDGHWVCP